MLLSILNTTRGVLCRAKLWPSPINWALKAVVVKLENEYVARRAATWKLDALGRLEWIDGMGQMIQTAKRNYNEDIR